MSRTLKTRLFYLGSFLIPCGLLVCALAYTGAVPFGDNSILWRDAEIQYIDFVSYLRTMLRGENGFLYSFSKNLGGELVSLISYYLASPFNLLFALTSDESLPLVFTLISVLKLSFCGLTYFHASAKCYGCRGILLAFSTAYALMAYNVLYGWSIMWLDGVLVLPLLGLGLQELWQGKKPWRYCACLAYALFTNFYIGYMLCIASVLFSLVHMAMLSGELKKKLGLLVKFLGASCIGGLGSAFLWLPAFLALLEGRAKAGSGAADILFNFNPVGLPGKLVAGAASIEQVSSGTPHIFCGTLVLFLVLVFFLNRDISHKVKFSGLAVLAVLLVSFIVRPLNIVWHGFSPNYAFNFRYAFLFSYVMIGLAQYGLTRISAVGKKEMGLAAGLILVLILGVVAIRGRMDLEFVSIAGCAVSLAALVVAFDALVGNRRSRACAVLVLVSILEMGVNLGLSWDAVIADPETEMLHQEQYEAFCQRLSPVIDEVKQRDSGFYRMEKTLYHDMNDPMFFSYNGLSHFSSSQQKHILRLLEIMGLKNDQDICVYYRTGSTAGVDSLFGVKYLLSEEDMQTLKGYEKLETVNGIGIYENTNALPIAFLAQPDVLGVDLEDPDYFAIHNAVWQSASGVSDPVLIPADVSTVTLENLYSFPLDNGNTRYVRVDETKPASIVYEITSRRESPLYFFFSSYEPQDADIYINGEYNGYYFHELRWDMTNAGVYPVGEKVRIEIRLWGDQIALQDSLFYYEDLSALSRHTEAIRQRPVTLIPHSDSHLSGSCEAGEESLLVFTIPYDSGWKLYIDGAPAQHICALDALLAARIPAGSHTFEMRYVPRGGIAGCSLTVLALAAGALWYILDRKKGAGDGKKA